MKISVPFFVFETQCVILSILKVIFRSNPENNTCLRDTFVPRKIETIRLRPGSEQWAVRIKFWANGVYVDAVSEGYADTHYGDQHSTVAVHIKARRYVGPTSWVEFDVPVEDLLLAEKYAETTGYRGDEDFILEAKRRQEAALQVIHDLLK